MTIHTLSPVLVTSETGGCHALTQMYIGAHANATSPQVLPVIHLP